MIPDLLEKDLQLVFCGSALSAASYEKKAYYAGPQNRFWPTLHEVGLTDRAFSPQEYRDLLKQRIGLMDVVKEQKGVDRVIDFRANHQASVRKRILKFAPKIVAFTSKTAFLRGTGEPAEGYGKQEIQVGDTEIWVLPSPSAAARRYWSIEPWQGLRSRLDARFS